MHRQTDRQGLAGSASWRFPPPIQCQSRGRSRNPCLHHSCPRRTLCLTGLRHARPPARVQRTDTLSSGSYMLDMWRKGPSGCGIENASLRIRMKTRLAAEQEPDPPHPTLPLPAIPSDVLPPRHASSSGLSHTKVDVRMNCEPWSMISS